jgi:hypothetical protein
MNVEVVEERMLFDEVVPLNADRIAHLSLQRQAVRYLRLVAARPHCAALALQARAGVLLTLPMAQWLPDDFSRINTHTWEGNPKAS